MTPIFQIMFDIEGTMKELILEKLDLLIDSFQSILYEEDEHFIKNMKEKNIVGDDVARYMYWEWTQGIGLYGLWKLFEKTQENKYIKMIEKYFNICFELGLPAKNINTVAPMLTLAKYAIYTNNENYKVVCEKWASYIFKDMKKTRFGGLQHLTSDSINDEELWDDSLFMSVLFLAYWGKSTKNNDYIEEANYQFLLHSYYLSNHKNGLWYHGWTFKENNNFVDAFWGRGNCWITSAIPEFLELNISSKSEKRFLEMILVRQIESLIKYQNSNGMWHTLIDDKTSYLEASATCGFAYGMLKARNINLISREYANCIEKALNSVLLNIDDNGILQNVSYGTPMGRNSKDFYKEIPIKPMPYGQALAILLLVEKLGS